jgi:hypothetical protein
MYFVACKVTQFLFLQYPKLPTQFFALMSWSFLAHFPCFEKMKAGV